MIRMGSPVSSPAGVAVESTCKGGNRRISLRAWHPLVNLPAVHFSIEEFAHTFGLTIPPPSPRKRGKPLERRDT